MTQSGHVRQRCEGGLGHLSGEGQALPSPSISSVTKIALQRSFAVSQFGDHVARVAGPEVDPGHQRDRTDHRKKAKNRGYSRRYFWLVQGLHRRRSRSSRRLQCRLQQESCQTPLWDWGIGPYFSALPRDSRLQPYLPPLTPLANSEAFFRRAQELDARLFELLKNSPACAATGQNSTKWNKSTWAGGRLVVIRKGRSRRPLSSGEALDVC